MRTIYRLVLLPLLAGIASPVLADKINEDMHKAGTALTDLIPYIYNDDRFRAPENRDHIATELDQLIGSVEALPNLLERHAVVRQISEASLLTQLKQARHLFNTGNYATSQYLLGSAPILCSSCHIQDGIVAKSAPSVSREIFANAFSFAEFNYYIRNYDVAEKAYLEYLDQLDVKHSRITGGKTLQRLLDITLITDNNLNLSQDKLKRYQKIKDLDIDLQQRIDQWLQGIEKLAATPDNSAPIEQQMNAEFGADFSLKHEFIFDETKRPMALVWRSKIQKALMATTNIQEEARDLYLIAILERILGEQTELSLSNLYLKECVKLNVKEYSHRCLNEYESHLYFYYGGSSGEEPPPEALGELRRLRKLLKKGS